MGEKSGQVSQGELATESRGEKLVVFLFPFFFFCQEDDNWSDILGKYKTWTCEVTRWFGRLTKDWDSWLGVGKRLMVEGSGKRGFVCQTKEFEAFGVHQEAV